MSFWSDEKINPFYNDVNYTIQDWELEKYKKSDEILYRTSSHSQNSDKNISFGCVA